jgi:ABC-type antimicrobial peptide transport system permease subunit
MVGLDRFGVVGVLIAQALLYSIPGWILGIILGFVGNFVVMYILEYSSSIPLQKLISALIIIISTLIAFGISLIASLLPIRQALSQNLHEFIDVTHTKASAIMVTIERAEAL